MIIDKEYNEKPWLNADWQYGYAFGLFPVYTWMEGRIRAFTATNWLSDLGIDVALALVRFFHDAEDAGVPIKLRKDANGH